MVEFLASQLSLMQDEDDEPVQGKPQKGAKSTKIRVVMDGAAKYKGRTIYEMLAPGPNLIANLQSILVHMHLKPVAFAGDISSMFLRI